MKKSIRNKLRNKILKIQLFAYTCYIIYFYLINKIILNESELAIFLIFVVPFVVVSVIVRLYIDENIKCPQCGSSIVTWYNLPTFIAVVWRIDDRCNVCSKQID